MAMRTIDLKRFLREVKDQHTGQTPRPFCFVLGAGASIQSGIPMGGELVNRWLETLYEDAPDPKAELAKWATEENLGIPGFHYSRRDEFYGQVYAKRFEGTPRAGYAEIQNLLSGKEPSFGYSILAHILAKKQHKAVITTNFDNLVADALFLYSQTAPIQCIHESLAPFITTQLDRPLVIKVHRDVLLHPRSASEDIERLHDDWHAPLTNLLRHSTPIFIGYGGNDGSLMGFLQKLPAGVPDRIYWCIRGADEPNDKVKELLETHHGVLVRIPGFDELMLHLKQSLDLPDPLPDLEKTHQERVDRYKKQLIKLGRPALDASKADDATPEAKDLGEAASAAIKQLPAEDTPDSWILRAQAELDKDKAEALYREALEKHPNNGNLMCAFGDFLAEEKQAFEEAKELIRRAYEADPENPDRLHDYGLFLAQYLSDGRQAEPLLRRALGHHMDLLGNEHPETLRSRMNLANVLYSQGKYAEAEAAHREVLAIREKELGAEHQSTLGSRMNLANVLYSQGNYAEAEMEHRAVLGILGRVLGGEHLDTLTSRMNLANVLHSQGKYAEAEAGHREVLAIRERLLGAEHPDTLSSRNNLATALSSHCKHAEAEVEYRAVLAIRERVLGVEHPDTLSSRNNLANTLSSQSKYDEAEAEHREVLDIRERLLGPGHPDTLRSLFNLAVNQEDQGQLPEALALMQRAELGMTQILGTNHPDTQDAQWIRKRVQRKMKKPKGKKPRK